MLKSLINQKDKKQVLINFLSLLLIQGSNYILPLITFPYLVRNLGAEKYGTVMVAQSLAVFFTVIVDFGFNISATREVSLLKSNKKNLSNFYWSVFSIKSFLLICTLVILLLLILTVEKFRAEASVYLFSFGMVLGQCIFPTWFFQGIEKMKIITYINILAKLIFTACIFIFIHSSSDYYLVPIFNGGGFIVAGLIGLFLSLKYVYFKTPKIKNLKVLVKESAPLFLSNVATSFYTSSNTFILGIIAGDALAGVFAALEKLILAVKSLYIPLYQALFPWLSKKKFITIKSLINRMIAPISVSALIVFGVTFYFSEEILWLVYEDELILKYAEILRILSFIAIFSSLNMLFVTLYFPAIKKYKIRMKSMIYGGIYNIIICVLLANFFNIYGVALSAVSTELIILIISFYYFKKIENIA